MEERLESEKAEDLRQKKTPEKGKPSNELPKSYGTTKLKESTTSNQHESTQVKGAGTK